MNLDFANLFAAMLGGFAAIFAFMLGFFAFVWKMNRDLNAKLDRQQEQHHADMEKLREGLEAKLDGQQEQHRADMQALRAEFHQFRDEVRCELKELRGQIIKLWQHIKKS